MKSAKPASAETTLSETGAAQTLAGDTLATTAGDPFCWNALMRKLPTPGKVNPVLSSSVPS